MNFEKTVGYLPSFKKAQVQPVSISQVVHPCLPSVLALTSYTGDETTVRGVFRSHVLVALK